jgi:hypothetical protein
LVAAWFAVTSYPEDTDAALFAPDLNRGDIEALDITTGQSASGSRFDDPFDMTDGVYLIETAPDLGIDASHIFLAIDGLCRTLDWKLRTGRGFSPVS